MKLIFIARANPALLRMLSGCAAVALVAAMATASPAAASLTSAPSVAAAQAAATAQVCDLIITNVDPSGTAAVTAEDLNEGGNGDEIFGKFEDLVSLDGVDPPVFSPSVGTVQFPTAGTGRSAASFDFPIHRFNHGFVNWKLVEDDPFINDPIDAKILPCKNDSGHVEFAGKGAVYDVEAVTQVVSTPI